MPSHFSCGLDFSHVRDLQEAMDDATSWKFQYTCMPIVHPRHRREYKAGKPVTTMFSRTDMLLGPMDWNVKVVGKMSPYLDVDCVLPELRQQHEDCLMEELHHARCLGLSAVMITLRGPKNTNLARLLHNITITNPTNNLLWIQVPMEDPSVNAFHQHPGDSPEPADEQGSWGWWRDLHRLLEWDRRCGVALRLSAQLPEETELERWLGEPVKCLVVPTNVFITNKKGFPILPKAHQHFVKRLMERDVHLLVSGALRHADYSNYLSYLCHLWDSRSTTMQDVLTSFARGWEDYLQTPLQPLSDNLDSHTYNVFEKDPVKYDTYQKAVVDAFRDRYPNPPICAAKSKSSNKDQQFVKVPEPGTTMIGLAKSGVSSVGIDLEGTTASSPNAQMRIDVVGEDPHRERETRSAGSIGTIGSGAVRCPRVKSDGKCGCKNQVIVMVLGAGRGPLVRAVINAATIVNIDLKIYAVEKNPTALLALYAQQREIWRNLVTVVASDMRDFRPPQLADIIVSELLGSFGDNELSPECLDGARHLLRTDGISIPSSYSSYICPVMSARLWGHVKGSDSDTVSMHKPVNHHMETLWVVYLQNKLDIAEPQELFTFTHPAPVGAVVDRRRWAARSFKATRSSVMHGFCGYFSSVLYKQHRLSIVPGEHSPGMISWFPVFIPIKSPINIKPGDTVEANFWRCSDPRKVWYEWNVTAPELVSIHNSAGRSSDMLL